MAVIVTWHTRATRAALTYKRELWLRVDGKVVHELTLYEVWKKKDVKPGEPPKAWRLLIPIFGERPSLVKGKSCNVCKGP